MLNFRCDSPNCRRFMQVEVAPAPNGDVRFANHLLREEHRPIPPLLDPDCYRAEDIVEILQHDNIKAGPDSWMEVDDAAQPSD